MSLFFSFSATSAVVCTLAAIWVAYKVLESRRRPGKYTPLAGPPSTSLLFGVTKTIADMQETGEFCEDAGKLFEEWAEKYGPVYRIPAAFGFEKVVLCDPKAIQHFYSRETTGYVHTTMMNRAIAILIGRGVLWAEGDAHKRQRKALSPAFSNAAIRRMTSVFYDSAYKLKLAWDNILDTESSDAAVIDVERWMNNVSLDTIGIAGFSHDFGTLVGRQSAVASTFAAFADTKPSLLGGGMQFVIGLVFPWVLSLPTDFRRLVDRLHGSVARIARDLVENANRESAGLVTTEDKSLISVLLKAGNTDTELRMSKDEVLAQVKVLIMAGYETTSISLSWCLLELSRKPDIQQKLREELLAEFAGKDPTWDQLMTGLPYLDAVVHETLRLHPPLPETEREAAEDDVLPLSTPLRTADGRTVDSVAIPKGSVVLVPAHAMNRSVKYWGADAKEFKPERWLIPDGILKAAQDIQGHRHLLTFADGPRICLGRHFALAEFKAVIFVLIKSFRFELRDGPDTKFEIKRAILPRPRISGEGGTKLPLRVRRVE
ncbi:cytochrome P450 [Fomitopsis betulina]|nr:cytochrome P450 [Fomitopsis betulina]